MIKYNNYRFRYIVVQCFTNHGLLEARLDFAEDPVECLATETVLLDDLLGAEHRAYEAVHEESSVAVGLHTKTIAALANHELLFEVAYALHDLHRMQVGRLAHVNSEDFLRVPDEPLQVAWQHYATVAVRESVAERVAILHQLFPLRL